MTDENVPPAQTPAQVEAPAPGQEPAPAAMPLPGSQPGPLPAPAAWLPEQPEVAAGTAAPRGRRRLALVTAGVLVAVAAAGGVGYATLHHGGSGDAKAARTTAATPWSEPTPSATEAFGARSGGSHYGSLALLLLPTPDNYGPGPDVEAFGNDVVLDAHQAQDLVRGDVTDLPAKERKAIQADVDALRIEGAGLRTYTQHDNQLVIQMEIVQMKNKDGARSETRFFTSFTKALGVFRSGPKIAGHPQAVCVLPPKERKAALEEMYCQATEGDLMIKMTASGTLPLEKAEAADLLHKQLDRVRDPGQAV